MNTQTHLLVSAALFMRPGEPQRNAVVLAGALVPDLTIYTMFGFATARGVPDSVIWGQMHFSDFWQDWLAATNSIPIYVAIAILGLSRNWTLVTMFALSALVHISLDFPVHHEDAHRHFWPVSDWRFASPLSYWDPAHYGRWVVAFELALGVAMAATLFRRFKAPWVRVVIGLSLLPYVIIPLYWMGVLG